MSGALPVTRGYVVAPQPPLRQLISVSFALPQPELVPALHARDIRSRFRGDAVAAMDSFGADLILWRGPPPGTGFLNYASA